MVRGKGKAPSKRELDMQVASMHAQLAAIKSMNVQQPQNRDSDEQVVVSTGFNLICANNANTQLHQNVQYTPRMVEILLELRYETFGSKFLQNTSNAQRAVLWEKLRIKFNIATSQNVTVVSLKNKITNLRREYSRHVAFLRETGNDTDNTVPLPEYWDTLVQYFGDKHGMGHIAYADDGLLESAGSSSQDDADGDSEEQAVPSNGKNSHKRIIQDEIERQQKMRKPNTNKRNDISSGLVALGESLSKGIVEAANLKSSRPSTDNLENAISETNKQL
ncbi:hypothetical protein AC1031_000566 [Aphanomyces cochlioides]|nr:hypothetical protein AC1031_000566 [Aphanomyces cochlioides]